MPLSWQDANKAIALYAEVRDLRAARDVAEGFYSEAVIVVSNSASNKTVKIDKRVALASINALIAGIEVTLTSLGFDPDA
jgi:hypothetical protein